MHRLRMQNPILNPIVYDKSITENMIIIDGHIHSATQLLNDSRENKCISTVYTQL